MGFTNSSLTKENQDLSGKLKEVQANLNEMSPLYEKTLMRYVLMASEIQRQAESLKVQRNSLLGLEEQLGLVSDQNQGLAAENERLKLDLNGMQAELQMRDGQLQ